jgi:small subunit ribosomal protein S21
MIRVQVRPNEPLEAALRRFKRQCNYAGIFRLAKKYAYHEKRSDRRRREERERLRSILIAEKRREGSSGTRTRTKKRRVRSSSVRPGRGGEADFDPLTADTTIAKPAAAEE